MHLLVKPWQAMAGCYLNSDFNGVPHAFINNWSLVFQILCAPAGTCATKLVQGLADFPAQYRNSAGG